jgi:putative ATP-dependent endonuclease of the OLD family
VSVISVGGKDNLSSLARLVVRLGINCFVVADFNFLLRDKESEREQFGQKARASLADFDWNFFAQSCVFGVKGKAAHEGLRQLREAIRGSSPEMFYIAKRASEIQHDRLANALSGLFNSRLTSRIFERKNIPRAECKSQKCRELVLVQFEIKLLFGQYCGYG